MRVFFYLHRLGVGGAERQFVQISADLAARGHEVALVTNVPGGGLENDVDPGVERLVLHARTGGSRVRRLSRVLEAPRRLAALVEERRPDVVYSANYEPNALAWRGLVRGRTPVVWGIRGSDQELPFVGRTAARYGRRVAPRVAGAVFNSRAGRDWHLAQGWALAATEVVPNGLDVQRFRPDPGARRSFREELGLPVDAFVIVLVGRLVEVKDHGLFLAAAAELGSALPDARFVCVGGGRPVDLQRVEGLVRESGLGPRVVLAGDRPDVERAFAAADVAACTSHSEGFPNVLGEAMATGLPCVSTDVGDAAWILGDTGRVARDREPRTVAGHWRELHDLGEDGRRSLGAAARRRVVETFSREACARATEDALARLAGL